MFRSNFRTKTAVFSITALLAVALLTLNLSAKTDQTTTTSSLQVLSPGEMEQIAGGATCKDGVWVPPSGSGNCSSGNDCDDDSDCGADFTVSSSSCSCTGSLIQNDYACETYPAGSSWTRFHCRCAGLDDDEKCRITTTSSHIPAIWCRTSSVWCGTIQ